jgi:hypothetical protein
MNPLLLAVLLTFGGQYPTTDVSDTCGVEFVAVPPSGDSLRVEWDVWDLGDWRFTGAPYARGFYVGRRGERFHGAAVVPLAGHFYKVRLVAVKPGNGMRSCPSYRLGVGR